MRTLNLDNINCISWIQFRSWLSPDGVNVFIFLIQNVSLVFSLSFSISGDVFSISCNCSIIMNLTCRLKLCLVWLKCLSTDMALGSLESFLWLFNRIFKAVSAFPTYWIVKSSHSSKYMMKLLLQVVFLEYSKCSVRLITFEMLCYYYLSTTKCPWIWKTWWTFSVGEFVSC